MFLLKGDLCHQEPSESLILVLCAESRQDRMGLRPKSQASAAAHGLRKRGHAHHSLFPPSPPEHPEHLQQQLLPHHCVTADSRGSPPDLCGRPGDQQPPPAYQSFGHRTGKVPLPDQLCPRCRCTCLWKGGSLGVANLMPLWLTDALRSCQQDFGCKHIVSTLRSLLSYPLPWLTIQLLFAEGLVR